MSDIMSPESLIDLFRNALYLAILILCVIILPSLIVGLIISLFQAATQINEQTLSFLPRLMVTLLALSFAGPWISKELIEFTQALILDIPFLLR